MDAELVGYDLETDVAVLKAPVRVMRHLKFGDSDQLTKGQLVLAFANTAGQDDSLSMGVVSSVARQLGQDDPMIYLETDVSLGPQGDGGPLVNTQGELIGLADAGQRGRFTATDSHYAGDLPKSL